MKRFFVDMDGTLAEFKYVNTIETLYEPGYFRNLLPQTHVVKAIKDLVAFDFRVFLLEQAEVYILSSVLSDSQTALQEKNEWLDEHLPEIDKEHRLFSPCGKDKAVFLKENGFELSPEDCLIDDYTKNLISWQEYGGTGIKLLNGINHTHGTWKGSMLNKHTVHLLDFLVAETYKAEVKIQHKPCMADQLQNAQKKSENQHNNQHVRQYKEQER